MAYIQILKNREGKKYVYLVEGYRENGKVKKRTLKKFGLLEDLKINEPDILDRLKKEAKDGTFIPVTEKEISITLDLEKKIGFSEKNYSWKLLADLYKSLGIKKVLEDYETEKKHKYSLNEILQLLVYQRILAPQSKSATLESQKNLFGDWNIIQNHMDRSLDHFHKLKEKIQLSIHQNITKTIGRTGFLVFYDVTNYYFEADLDDKDILDKNGELLDKGFRKRDPSKEKRPNPIVQMGLFMDQNGIPIAYKLFPGNHTDPITYIPSIEEVKKRFGIDRIVTVADKAMNSKKNIKETFENNDGWLFSQKFRGKRGAPKDIQEYVLDRTGWEYNETCTFAKKSMIREREIAKNMTVKEKVLVTWSEKYANREKKRRDGAVEFANGLRQPEKFRLTCKKGGKKYLEQYVINKETGEIEILSPFLAIDYELVEYDAQFDGINVLVTSEIMMDDEEILDNYKQLYKIEDCFRITKTDLQSRPIFVWTKEHIESHFLTCFISLVMLRVLQYKLSYKFSILKIVEGLKSGRSQELSKGYWQVQGNEDFIEMNKMLNIFWEKEFVKYEELKKYGSGWFATKK